MTIHEEGQINPAFDEDVFDVKIKSDDAAVVKTAVRSSKEKGTLQDAEPNASSRDRWAHPAEFMLSCIALSVGLGNVWRFPATALANGGGAFLIPYLLVLTFIGRPLYYMELCMGQFSSFGCVKCWNMAPAMKGIGYGQTISVLCILTYYVALMAFTMYYFLASFSTILPWSTCPENATNCFDFMTNTTGINFSEYISSSEYYYNYEVANIYVNGLDDGISAPDWRLVLCLLGSWIILVLILAKGVQSSGKAAYFTALFPYVVLFMLLIRGCLLPGAARGIMYFLTPQWHKLLEPQVWKNAVGQCFFSLSVAFGAIPMMASYNDFRHNVYRDTMIIAITDTLTSILAGCITFSIMGYLADQMGLDDIQNVIKDGGTGLAFISYPDVISRFTWCPQLFAVLFFLMLFTLGAGSAAGLAGSVITIICDNFPAYRRLTVTLVISALCFLVGIFYMTPQGQFLIALVDAFAGDTAVYLLAIAEIIAVQYIYGYKRFLADIDFMLGRKMGIYWKLCWTIITPGALICILIYSFVEMGPMTKGSYTFGPVSMGLAIGLAAVIIGMVPIFILLQLKKHKSVMSKKSPIKAIFEPSPKWGPQDPQLRTEYDLQVLQNKSGPIHPVTLVSVS